MRAAIDSFNVKGTLTIRLLGIYLSKASLNKISEQLYYFGKNLPKQKFFLDVKAYYSLDSKLKNLFLYPY
jgi:hypothetical protein